MYDIRKSVKKYMSFNFVTQKDSNYGKKSIAIFVISFLSINCLMSQIVDLGVINDNDGYTNVREIKRNDAKILTKIYEGEVFAVEKSSENWWKVITKNGIQGYVHKSRINIIENLTKYNAKINDIDGFTNIRADKGINFQILDKLYEGELFIAEKNEFSNWWLIRKSNGIVGFVHNSRIQVISPYYPDSKDNLSKESKEKNLKYKVYWKLPFFPFSISIGTEGFNWEVDVAYHTKRLGTFGVSVESQYKKQRPFELNGSQVTNNDLLVVLRNLNAQKDEVFKVTNGVNFGIIIDGTTEIIVKQGMVIIDVTKGNIKDLTLKQ